jgi:hypothetical protein
MKLLTAFAAITFIAAPAQAQVYEVYNGDLYTRCHFTGSSTFCKHGDAARSERDRTKLAEACEAKAKAAHVEKYGHYTVLMRGTHVVGKHHSSFLKTLGHPEVFWNDAAHAEYKAATQACFTAQGF